MNILSIKNISKKFNAQTGNALKDVSLEINGGEVVCFIGENGAGKSTLFKSIAGLIQLDSGSVFLGNTQIKGPEDQLLPGHKEIKLLNQESKLSPNRTVFENIQYELRSHIKKYINERSDQLLKLCEVDHLRNKYSGEISGGQRQRAALAVALASDPSILLLDEPFSEADIFQKNRLKKNLMTLVKASNTTCLFSTHEPVEALSLADRIVVMQQGTIIQSGKPVEIYNKPIIPYVAQLLGKVNYIPKEFIKNKLHNIKANNTLGIRIEDLFQVEEAESVFAGEVVNCIYQGSNYEIEVKIEEFFTVFYNSVVPLKKKQKVFLNYYIKKLLVF